MAKKIRFPLKMKNGAEVRTLDELKENFDIDSILKYYIDGKLYRWLTDRYYDEKAEEISALSMNDINFNAKICEILEVEYQESDRTISDFVSDKEKLDRYIKLGGDEEYSERISQIAMDQQDLDKLIEEGISEIYLYKGNYSVDLSRTDITYTGIDKVTVTASNMDFSNVYDIGNLRNVSVIWEDKEDNVQKLLDCLRNNSHNKSAVSWIGVSGSDLGNSSASLNKRIVKTLTDISEDGKEIYKYGKMLKNTMPEVSAELFRRAANQGSNDAMYELAKCYENGFGTKKNTAEAVIWLGKAHHFKHSMALGELKRLAETDYNAKAMLERIDKPATPPKKRKNFFGMEI